MNAVNQVKKQCHGIIVCIFNNVYLCIFNYVLAVNKKTTSKGHLWIRLSNNLEKKRNIFLSIATKMYSIIYPLPPERGVF